MIARFSKRANDIIKSLIDKLQKNVTTASSSKKSGLVTNTTSDAGTVVATSPKDARQSAIASGRPKSATSLEKIPAGTVTGVKRARNSEVSAMQPAKRASSGVANSNLSISTTAKRAGSTMTGKSTSGGTPASATSQSNVISKPKGHQVVAKPTNFFSSLQPALKKNAAGSSSSASASVEAQQKAVANRYIFTYFETKRSPCQT